MVTTKNTKPRVLLLLRVSTSKQANGNEDCLLPVQQEKCTALCEQNGWEIVGTITETKSAYKNGMYERESIIDIENRADNGEYDILVAFKLDRIGRKGNETTHFITSLLEKGIRVFTVVEGEITADSFEDEFMLAFRGLSAKQESRNISVRVKAALEILIQNGGYRGGAPMFGYKLVPTGKTNRKGRMINNLCIEEREAELVRQLFRMTAEEGKGTHQLAEYLNNKGIKTHNNAKFQPTNIMRILKNRIYIGHLDTKDIKGPYQEHLRIIDDETFYKVQEILEQRSAVNAEKRTISLNTKGLSLLSGNVFCGHCGGRITTSSSSCFYETKEGIRRRYVSKNYVCGNRANRRCDCDGQAGYKADVIDKAVEDIVIAVLSNIADTPESTAVARTYEIRIAELKKTEKRLKTEFDKLCEKEKKLILEIGNALIGESRFTSDQLNDSLEAVKAERINTEETLKNCTKRLENLSAEKEYAKNGYSKLTAWAEEYSLAGTERKKMIIAEIFDRVEIKKGYEIEITMNEIYRPFMTVQTTKED